MMTEQEQRIAIAEWMGFVKKIVPYDYLGEQGTVDTWTLYNNSGEVVSSGLPNYPNNLNAMHEAEKKLSLEQRDKYVNWLYRITEKGRMASYVWLCTNATSQQRSEALCRTLWPERFEE